MPDETSEGKPTARTRGTERSHARRNCTANLTPTTNKANELVTRREERPGNHSSLPPPPSCPFHTNQQTASLPRRGYEDYHGMAGRGGGGGPQGLRGCSIRPLKRAEGRRRRMGNPSLTQKPRRERLGEGLARNLRRDAVDTADPERGRPRTTAFLCSEHTILRAAVFFRETGNLLREASRRGRNRYGDGHVTGRG